jgi:hypothetical protein
MAMETHQPATERLTPIPKIIPLLQRIRVDV